MDSKGFRIQSEPELIQYPTHTTVNQETSRQSDASKTIPAPDTRYHAYASKMEDGRLLTDYRQACVGRAPPGTQYAVKQWTIDNTDEIIRISRLRQVQTTGHALGSAPTEMPPATYQSCTTDSCKIEHSGYTNGIGIERIDSATPSLFGTFDFDPNTITLAKNTKSIGLTKKIEYGRNTPTRWGHLYQ